MGVAAYYRGSAAISRSIENDYLDRGGRAKRNVEMLERAEVLIKRLETYCQEVQAFFSDMTCPDSAKGLAKASMHDTYLRKQKTAKFQRMLTECNLANCEWVDSDIRYSITHLQVCYRKARAWKAVMDYLNPPPSYHLPFSTPSM